MSTSSSARDDLDYVVSVVRRHGDDSQTPGIYVLWAAIVLVGFALPDFAPTWAGPYWFVAGTLGGLASWWLGTRKSRAAGIHDRDLDRRYGMHWLVTGIAFVLAALPMMTGAIDMTRGASLFLLVGGLAYTLAAVHLERGTLWSGIVMLVAYVALLLFQPPYVWTISGIVIAASLIVAAWQARRPAA